MDKLSTIDCFHFPACSGCSLNQEALRPPLLAAMRAYFDRHQLPLAFKTGSLTEWRSRAKLAVRGTLHHPIIGLFRKGTHTAMEIPYCQVHHPAINKAVERLKQALIQQKIQPYSEATHTGHIRYIQCTVDLDSSLVQLVLVFNKIPESISDLISALDPPSWHSIWTNQQSIQDNRIFGPEWRHHAGPHFLLRKLHHLNLRYHPGAFIQAHWELFHQLAADVAAAVPPSSRLVEYYAGVGALGLLAASHCLDVQLVESNPYAQNNYLPPNARQHLVPTAQALPLLDVAECVIVDPPRKGLDPLLLQRLQSWRGKLLYVSCHFSSFARDAAQLLAAGYKLQSATAYLLFPGSDTLELFTEWVREKPAAQSSNLWTNTNDLENRTPK